MKDRCTRPGCNGYHCYGGRGITVCERWQDSFTNFWDDIKETYQPGFTLDRIDPNGNYEPGNCRWASLKTQGRNRRYNAIIETPKGRMTIAEASEIFGIQWGTIKARIRSGWPESRLLESPAGHFNSIQNPNYKPRK